MSGVFDDRLEDGIPASWPRAANGTAILRVRENKDELGLLLRYGLAAQPASTALRYEMIVKCVSRTGLPATADC